MFRHTEYFAFVRQESDRAMIRDEWVLPRPALQTMKIMYFADTDTLSIRLREAAAAGSRDLDENTLIDLDDAGQLCSITIEHASRRADISNIAIEGLAA